MGTLYAFLRVACAFLSMAAAGIITVKLSQMDKTKDEKSYYQHVFVAYMLWILAFIFGLSFASFDMWLG